MRLLWTIPALFAVVLLQAAAPMNVATHVGHEKVAACAKGVSLFKVPEYEVICYNKAVDGAAEVHPTHGHVFYILEGEATFVTGGTLVAGKTPTINGGVENHLTKGDVIVVPAGTNHWFKKVMSPVAYYSVNVETKP